MAEKSIPDKTMAEKKLPEKKTPGQNSLGQKVIQQYEHQDKERPNNPPVGLVTPFNDREAGSREYSYDPHLDPQLNWAGKSEHTSFEVPTVSLHIHERIDPKTIIQAIKKKSISKDSNNEYQQSFFDIWEKDRPLREAIEFYRHKNNWVNRLIAGDSLLVMNSLLEKEGMVGKVQMIYMDPPYGIKYGSNFQPFVNKRDVKDGNDEDLTSEPETLKAFRDTWELGIHSYLTYLRDRLLLARELLHESGSVFVQINDENVHNIRNLIDEIFNRDNFVSQINFTTTGSLPGKTLPRSGDYIVWYAKSLSEMKYHQLYFDKPDFDENYKYVELPSGERRGITREESEDLSLFPQGSKIYRLSHVRSQGKVGTTQEFVFQDKLYNPGVHHHWKTTIDGLKRLAEKNRLVASGNTINYVMYQSDFPVKALDNLWKDTSTGGNWKVYCVQTNVEVVKRCTLMTTDPGDVVFDPTCGSGTTAYVAEKWGRRWITCDTSRVALVIARERLMTALYDYYELAKPKLGVSEGFKYKTVPHVTLKSIANNEPPAMETLYDQPLTERGKVRVSGPFTVEAVPAPVVKPIIVTEQLKVADIAARTGETFRQVQWREELIRTGIRGKGGQKLTFTRIEPLAGMSFLHAAAELRPEGGTDTSYESGKATKTSAKPGIATSLGPEAKTTAKPDPEGGATHEAEPGVGTEEYRRVLISFGGDFSPVDALHVGRALEEAQSVRPQPHMIVFAGFQFDPEAAKDIDETRWEGVTLLKVQMNADLLTEDLKKHRASNESFWLIGQPDVKLTRLDNASFTVEVRGFDYFNTITGKVESGSDGRIAVWMLDTDYDGRSVFPTQVFFPMSGEKDSWKRLARNLKAEIDPDLVEAYRGTASLPFEAGKHKRIAVKIVDDRGIESMRIISLR